MADDTSNLSSLLFGPEKLPLPDTSYHHCKNDGPNHNQQPSHDTTHNLDRSAFKHPSDLVCSSHQCSIWEYKRKERHLKASFGMRGSCIFPEAPDGYDEEPMEERVLFSRHGRVVNISPSYNMTYQMARPQSQRPIIEESSLNV